MRKSECGLRPRRAVGSIYELEAVGVIGAYAPEGLRPPALRGIGAYAPEGRMELLRSVSPIK
jgi:hypothetical protein